MTTLIIIAIVVLALGCSVKISVSCTEDEEKDLVPPCGLGGYVIPEGWGSVLPDTSGKIRARPMSYHGQQTRKTHALMKELEAELEERSDPTRKTIPWGEPSRKAITSRDKPLRSDEIYEEPQAIYPMEMKL